MKIASRFLLPLELVIALLMVSWSISGWFGGGLLWVRLSEHGLNTEWGLSLCAVGVAQLAAAGTEWCFGRCWERRRLLGFVRALLDRLRCCGCVALRMLSGRHYARGGRHLRAGHAGAGGAPGVRSEVRLAQNLDALGDLPALEALADVRDRGLFLFRVHNDLAAVRAVLDLDLEELHGHRV
jgi:hypothetical protein